MSDGRLTVWIGGREALPVRGIPYVGGWSRFFPNRTVDYLAQKVNSVPRCASLTAYHRPDGNMPVPVNPREWNSVAVKLRAFEAELRQQYPNFDMGYETWRNNAVVKLPCDVFVWLDEFELAFRADVEYAGFSDDQPDTVELTLTPMIDANTRAMVMEGFEPSAAINPSTAKTEVVPVTQTEETKPWLIADPADPEPKYPWYTPARYFARQLVKENSTLLTKRKILAGKVAKSLIAAGFKKRGGKLPLVSETILKALSNVFLG